MSTFVLEIRAEEIPANALPNARTQLEQGFQSSLAEAGFDDIDVVARSTSRRLIVIINHLPGQQVDRQEELSGPPARIAFDADGQPTKAALGFAKKAGVPVEDLRTVETPKGDYLTATVTHKGRPTKDILAEIAPQIINALRFPKMMRWGLGTHIFARPVHGIVALLGNQIVEFEAFGIAAGRSTVGHRVHCPESFDVEFASEYEQDLLQRSVIVDPGKRLDALQDKAASLAEKSGCRVHDDPKLVAEHVELVEWPGLIIGSIEARFLELPPEVVVSTLRHHQKCLILEDDDGTLQPHFLAVIDRMDDPEGLIRLGNQWVIGARLADAEFFFNEDRKTTSRSRIPLLERVEWHRVLGSLADKAARIGGLAVTLSEQLEIDIDADRLREAANLVKTDLVTNMVNEFTDLQGVMGGHYLRLEGADQELWTAARDHYTPVGFDGPIPSSIEGRLLGLADRLDTIAGLFAVGEKPTGSKDPLGLRRAAQGLVKILAEAGWNLDIEAAVVNAVAGVENHATAEIDEIRAAILDFLGDRVRRWLTDKTGIAGDTAEAVMEAGWGHLQGAIARGEALEAVRESSEFRALSLAFKRVKNITDGHDGESVDPALFEDDSETELWNRISVFHTELGSLLAEHKVRAAFEAMEPIATSLDQFFVDVLVMAEDERVRANRIALLKTLGRDFLTLADLSKLQIEGGDS